MPDGIKVHFGSSRNAKFVKAGFVLVAKSKKMAPVLAKGMTAEMISVIEAAVPLTPLLTGDLRESRFVQKPKIKKQTVSIVAGFGGGVGPVTGRSIDYAIPVHEDLSVFHPVGQAKFLEIAFNANVVEIQKNLAHLTRSKLRSLF